MKKIFTVVFALLIGCNFNYAFSQQTGSFTVGGDDALFYPVTFYDGGWEFNRSTNLKIGRSNVHINSTWRGSFIANFDFHVYSWGHGASYIDAKIIKGPMQFNATVFVGGWKDATNLNNSRRIIIWLKGASTYYYTATELVNPVIYDGVQSPLPFQEISGPAHGPLSAVEPYVNQNGDLLAHDLWVQGSGTSSFSGSLGIGTTDTKGYKLAVNGEAIFSKVKVKAFSNWPDFVFKPDYKLRPLSELKSFINQHRHLPDVPSEQEVAEKGQDLGEMNKILLQKVEELTLYVIRLNEELEAVKKAVKAN